MQHLVSDRQQAAFGHSLQSSLELAQRLERALLDEGQAILGHDPDHLQTVLASKLPLVTALERATRAQQAFVEASGQTFSPAGMTNFFKHWRDHPHWATQWERLREQVARCDNINRHNAELIERDRRRIATSLQVLRGEDPTPTTYNPSGRADPGEHYSHSLSHA